MVAQKLCRTRRYCLREFCYTHISLTIDADELQDLSGHGTHVASLVGSTVFGVAKSCNIVSVKIADANRFISTVTFADAVNWIVDNHEEIKQQPGWKGTIINMSLGIKHANDTVRLAIRRADNAGIVIVNASGNDAMNVDDSDLYPAESWRTISVSGSLQDYEWLTGRHRGTWWRRRIVLEGR
jgi:subtilase-type proteinase RRT12